MWVSRQRQGWPRHRGHWARPTKEAPNMDGSCRRVTPAHSSPCWAELLQRRVCFKFTCFTCAGHTRVKQGILDDYVENALNFRLSWV